MKIVQKLLLGILVVFAMPVSAQLETDFLETQTELSVDPYFPQPGDTVEVEFTNFGRYSADDVVWSLNGEVIANANNRRSVEYEAGELGTTDIVTATIIRSSGYTRNFEVAVTPTYVDIIIEPQTRIPDFYKGRALPSIGSRINATALVNNGSLLTDEYTYTWSVNGRVLEEGPIRGANQVTFNNPQDSRVVVSLTIANNRGRVLGQRAIYYQTVKPDLEFYEFNSLHGQSHNAITDTLLLLGGATTLRAEPFYLDIRTYNDPDVSEWEIDREVQTNNSNPYQITIQQTENDDTNGTSEVNFHVRNTTTQLLQGTQGSIKVAY